MIRLIETIRIVDGHFMLLPLHERRMMSSCLELYGCEAPSLGLTDTDIPCSFRNGVVKCRVTYDREIVGVKFERYTPRLPRSLRLVCGDSLDYHLKYADRGSLSAMHALCDGADEVIIVRDGLVTDTTYSNLLFRVPGGYLTPARPLLGGVMRRHLIESGIAREADITPGMLRPGNDVGITEVSLVNAMLPPGAIPSVPVGSILH